MASIPQGSALNTAADAKPLSDQIRAMVKPLASLKITVTVFSLSMFLILIGSLAQARTDVWEVVGQYFRCWVAWIDIKDFFPPAFFPSLIEYNWDELWINKACVKMFNRPQIPFFGGWTLGLVATINLLAAHGLRFKVQVKGQRLLAGTATLAVGLVVTWFVVAGGMNADGFQSQPKLSYQTVWQIFQVSVVICCLGLGWQLWKHRSWITGGIGLLLVATMYFACVSKPLSEPSMRILWQLMKAEFASVILLAACWLLFKKRSGVVLLHAGVAVLMLSEVLVGLTVSENRFQMWEGDSANYVFDLRERELVVVDNSGDEAKVVSIPETMILNAAASEDDARVIDDERLPFKIQLVDFYRHSTLKNAKPDDENPANAGTGLKVVATELPKAGGMDSRSDESTAYVRLLSRKDDSDLGTFMLAMRLEGSYEPVLVDGKIYDMALRFKRTYKDYSVTLLDVEKRDYIGTTTPRDYSSYIRLVDEGNNVDREIRVWMNNPLRYRGETLYQTDYFLDTKTGRELSSLQVVNNRGWMLPYMACMIVLTGMAVQFGIVLLRYLRRREQGPAVATTEKRSISFSTAVLCTALGLVVAGYFASKARIPKPKDGEPNLFAFGEIPAVKSGRQQPLSSVAMNRMRVLTDGKSMFQRELRESELMADWDEKSQEVAAAIDGLEADDLKGFEGGVPELIKFIAAGTEMHEQEVHGRLAQLNFFGSKSIITRKAPAIWWLLDQISQRPEASRHRIIRIDNPELKGSLNLEDRTPPVYCLAEVMEHYDELQKDLEQASAQFQKNSDNTTQYQRRLLELATNVSRIRQTQDVFSTLKYDANRPHESLVRMADYKAVLGKMGAVSDSALVMPIPTPSEDVSKQWESFALATLRNDLLKFAEAKNVTSVDGLVEALITQLPDEVVVGEIDTTIRQLKTLPSSDSVNQVAAELIPRIGPEERRIKEILQLIADSDQDNAKAIVDDLPTDKRDQLFNLGAANALLAMNDHVSPDAKSEMETVFRSGDVTKDRVSRLVETYTAEVASKLFTDEQVANGPSKDVTQLAAILKAWKDGKADEFNKLVAKHNENMATTEIAEIDTANTSFEAWYNNAAPASYGCVWYIIAFVLACASLIGWTRPLSRASFVIALVTFVFHTFALYARIEISGRPPVTNLYGSAVFIGWGAVLLGLIFEFIYKSGIGNLVSTMTGGLTLFIAYYLGADGDTFEVLQAVLDTQFWLATHVVCITLGYSATFLAGMFGLVYILKGVFTKSLRDTDRKDLSRMIYGTICFAMLFSFVGTILGGLWADDSWGRFWGWDPKENGAMMIVVWNAILMHARWDNMIKDRGVAVLSVAGNIVTAWSWFGVNELKAGLHTYGFTEGRLFWLTMFVLSQLLVICIGLFPKDMWRSQGKPPEAAAA